MRSVQEMRMAELNQELERVRAEKSSLMLVAPLPAGQDIPNRVVLNAELVTNYQDLEHAEQELVSELRRRGFDPA